MLKRFAQAGACAVLLCFGSVSVAEAKVVLGAGFGKSQFDYDDIDDGSARKFYAAYELQDSPAYFELSLSDSGDADITGFNSVTMNVSGTQIGAGYRFIFNHETGSNFFLKAGIYNTDTKVDDPDGEICGFACTAEDGNSGLYIGMGGDMMLNPSFGLRFDLEGLLGVEDFADDKNVTLFTVGPLFKFGGAAE